MGNPHQLQQQLQLQPPEEERAMPTARRSATEGNRASRKKEIHVSSGPLHVASTGARTDLFGAGVTCRKSPTAAKLTQLEEATRNMAAVKDVWAVSVSRLKVTSPMDEDFAEVAKNAELATAAYMGAVRYFQKVCEKV